MATSPHTDPPVRTVQNAVNGSGASGAGAARYRAEISTLRRVSRLVLVVGTGLAIASTFGPLLVVRLGVVPALAAALVSCLLAWREVSLERRAHDAAMLAASRRHGEQLTKERRHNSVVVEAMGRRVHSWHTLAISRAATIERLHAELQRLQGDVNGLRSANGRLTRDRNVRDLTIKGLRRTVLLLEAELSVEHSIDERGSGADDHVAADTDPAPTDDGAEVRAFRRRPLRDGPDLDPARNRDAAFMAAQNVIALPNYEDDRRFG